MKRNKRVTFRMNEQEADAFQMLVMQYRAWDESKLFRLLLQLGCHVIRHELDPDRVKRLVGSHTAESFLQRYRMASLAGKTQPSADGAPKPRKSDKASSKRQTSPASSKPTKATQ